MSAPARAISRGIVDFHAAVDFQANVAPAGVDSRARLGEFRQRLRDELLSAEPGIHRHQQDQIDLVDHVIQPVQRRRRIEHQARLAARIADELDGAVHMLRGLRMKADVGRPGFREIRHQRIDRRDHQMHVDGRFDARLAQRLAHHRTDGEIGHVVIVHHVEVDPVRAGGEHRIDFLAQTREIGGQNRGRNDDRHASLLQRMPRAARIAS